MAEKIPMTPAGQLKLKEELKRLKEVERPANVKAIEVARGHGDLSENADYSAAKEKQSFIEGRIRDIETDEQQTYRIVGEDEANIKSGRISITAPVARAMIGREVGDVVTLRTAKGVREYQISDVRFEDQ